MKVLFICSGTSKEGISSIVFNQGESLRIQNVDLDYFTIRGKGVFGYFINTIKLRLFLNRTSYDIIHAHYGLCGIIAVLAKSKKLKLIISYMGTDLLGYHARDIKTTYFGSLLVRTFQNIARYADLVIVKSKEMEEKLTANEKVVIPNGVDLNTLYPVDKFLALEKVGWDKSKKHILIMSDPKRPEKNATLAIEAFDRLNANDLELHFLREISQSEVINYYCASDVCILSSFHEGSPNVVKEAMACNRPIVSTDVGDVKWVMGNTFGCYIASFDPDGYTDKLNLALEFAQKQGITNGRERIIELGLDSESIAKRIVELYKYILNL